MARDAEHDLVPGSALRDQKHRASWRGARWQFLGEPCFPGKVPPWAVKNPLKRRGGSIRSGYAPGAIDEEKLYAIVDVLDRDRGSNAEFRSRKVALNWVTRKPGVDTVIVGARNEQQLKDNLNAASWQLTDAEVIRLDEVSSIPLPYPYWHQQKFASERNPPAKHVR